MWLNIILWHRPRIYHCNFINGKIYKGRVRSHPISGFFLWISKDFVVYFGTLLVTKEEIGTNSILHSVIIEAHPLCNFKKLNSILAWPYDVIDIITPIVSDKLVWIIKESTKNHMLNCVDRVYHVYVVGNLDVAKHIIVVVMTNYSTSCNVIETPLIDEDLVKSRDLMNSWTKKSIIIENLCERLYFVCSAKY